MDLNSKIKYKFIDDLLKKKEKDCGGFSDITELSSDEKKIFDEFEYIWNASWYYNKVRNATFNKDSAWIKVNSVLEQKRLSLYRKRLLNYSGIGVAASIVIIFSLLHFGVFTNQITPVTFEINTAYGQIEHVILPDSTRVLLNAGSSLVYNYNQQKGVREVKFDGEGFFDVAKRKSPFIINTKEGFRLRVFGTKFNLKSYVEDRNVYTTLLEGSVKVQMNMDEGTVLKPGQTLFYDKTTEKGGYLDVNGEDMLDWQDKRIFMIDTSLDEIISELERMYDVNIEIASGLSGDLYKFKGVLQEETVFDVLDAISQLCDIKYKTTNNTIIISKK
jgi:ferric-dicitrate binding protein FerR (iron transport regulator)